jgi:predicted RNA-binding Zn-ribbon protein involved in translation (DUF1610 family)
VRPGGKQVLRWERVLDVPDKTPEVEGGQVPCADTVGRLRVRRRGTTLFYSWAPGTGGEPFREIQQQEFGAEDIQQVALTAMTGQQPCDLDVRFLDFRVHNGTPAAAPVAAAAPGPTGGSRRSGWALALGVVVALGLGAWLAVRQGRRARTATAGATAPGGTGELAASVSALSFPCPDCGKNLRARADLAGKKVRCPQCKAAVVVPEGTGSGNP